jgi:hypothetical protein
LHIPPWSTSGTTQTDKTFLRCFPHRPIYMQKHIPTKPTTDQAQGWSEKKILFTVWHQTLLFSTPWPSVEGEQVACHAFADNRPNTPEIHQCKRCFQSIFQAFHKCSYCESARTIKGWVWLPDIVLHTIPVRDQEDLVMIVSFWIFSVRIGVKVQLHLSHTSL